MWAGSFTSSTALSRRFRFFGTATAAYQVEGGLDKCTWRDWEKRRVRSDGFPTVERHEEAGLACDHWNRFEADLAMMKRLGARMYRPY